MKVFTRKRLVAVSVVAAFVGVFLAIGAVSRSSPAVTAPLPASASWYWTMAVSPTNPDTLVVGTSLGLYRSTDGGKSWATTGPTGVEPTSLAQAGNTIYLGGVPVASGASPVIRTTAGRTAPDGKAVLEASTDGGATWQELHPSGLPDVAVQALAADPTSSKVVYAVLTTGALYRSSDGAQSFQLVSTKTEKTPWALAVTSGGGLVAGDMDTGSYVSTNGKSWQQVAFTNTEGSKMVMEYAVQPTDASRVLMTAFGVEMSNDGGKSWHVALNSPVMFGPVAWAASEPSVAYAIGFDGSVWRSDDNGEHWTKVS